MRGRRDHYLPQGYLKGFIDPARTERHRPLWMMRPHTGEWEEKSPKQIGYEVGLYDFANEAVEAEHADVTFKSMEDLFPRVRDRLVSTTFENWTDHLDFLCRYMQMIRARSPLYFEQKRTELASARVATVTAVHEASNRVEVDSLEGRPLTPSEIHDHTLAKMRQEIKLGVDWMAEFQWSVRITCDPSDPVITAEQPLFVRTSEESQERSLTASMRRADTWVFFPICWQACLVGNRLPFDSRIERFEPDNLRVFRHMVRSLAKNFVISPQPLEI